MHRHVGTTVFGAGPPSSSKKVTIFRYRQGGKLWSLFCPKNAILEEEALPKNKLAPLPTRREGDVHGLPLPRKKNRKNWGGPPPEVVVLKKLLHSAYVHSPQK